MARQITSESLEPLNKALGLGAGGSQSTELQDGIVDQVLEVGPIARRGRTIAGTTGVFRVVLRNEHVGAGILSTSFQPYQPLTAGVFAPYPDPVPDTFDFYILGASVERVSGVGTLDEAAIRITNIVQGFGLDNSAAAVTSVSIFTIASWNSLNTSAIVPPYGLTELREPYKTINLRIPRKGAVASPFLRFDTRAQAAALFDCVMMCALFPVALGQDVAV